MASVQITDPRIARLLQQAGTAQQSGDAARATRHYTDVLLVDPHQPVALNALGMIALKAGDAAAITWFERATAADPSAGPLWLNLAAAFRAQSDDAGERAALDRALALDQRNVMANFRLAELLDRTGDTRGAFERWQGLLAMLSPTAHSPELQSPELKRIVDIARDHVAAHGAKLAVAIDSALATQRAQLDPAGRRRFEACVDAMLGRRRIYVNECHGLHFPFLAADEFFDRAAFDWLPALEAATPAIIAEFQALYAAPDSGFSPYVTLAPGSPDNSWSALDNSAQWSARYLWRYGARDAGVCGRCPRTEAALQSVPRVELPGQAPTAFFSVLRPGTRLPAHSGVSNIRAIVHLPLVVPDGCGFRVGGETRSWRVGEAFAFDDTIEHEAWNDSDSLRAVLIFDVWNPHLSLDERALLQGLFGAMAATGAGAPNIAD